VIGLTGGTTTFLIAKAIKFRKNITVVTNAVNIAMELSEGEDIQVVLTGGVMRKNSYELCGPLAEKTVEGLNIGKMFLEAPSDEIISRLLFNEVNSIHRKGTKVQHAVPSRRRNRIALNIENLRRILLPP
jgi:DeoR/GlpR family transcriptional regulator of sugar metabolism